MKKLTAIGASAAAYLSLALPVFAQTNVNPCVRGGGVGFGTLCNFTLSGGFIGKLVTLAFILAVLIALAFLIWGGIRWILSGGDKTKVEEARGTIVAALVGLVIVFLAFFIINFVFTFFGLGSIQGLQIPNLRP
ncbi:MAG: hypothetical protein HYW63_01965 [Candidatus Levybacteria bacterium]|nr:hypothetical protein [Candidatus Levybacteria bacterium]